MTKPTEHACDSKRIADYLNERLSDAQQAEFETHLSGCEQCQREIQQQAAEPELWGHAVALLGQTSSAAFDESSGDSDSGFRSRQVQSVLDSLAPTDDPEMLGRIDDYEIIGVVGVGGMGAVLKGFDRSLRRVVAIKIMAPHLAGSGSARTRFQREARAAAAITHDNVVDIYGVSEANGLPYLVMPFARGPSLQKRIDGGGPLSVTEVLRIGRQIAAGLTAAHEQGLVHRDIKPANILLNDGIERLLITDFGVARAMDDASMTRTGVIAGTPQYMSPEQARGESVDYGSDLFSLGSVLYTACTGRPPFRSEAAYGILRRITDDDPRPIREINPDIPDWLCRIIERLMAKHPADRFQNAAEVTELLEGCLAHLQQPTQTSLPQSIASLVRPDIARSAQVERRRRGATTRSFRFSSTGVWIMVSSLLLTAIAFAAFQMTAPADIAGQWKGENWHEVSLSSVDEAADWYTGSFTNAAGQRGALQLEWSRLQRRYNGRWKLGDQQSGSITLRAGGAKGVRGAVSVDPDSAVVSNAPRLREFSWKRAADRDRSSQAAARVKNSDTNANASPKIAMSARPQSIQAPIKGFVVRLGKSITENASVKKGDRILEIREDDSELQSRLEEQMAAQKRQVEATQLQVQASERTFEAVKKIVDAQQTLVESAKRNQEQIAVNSATAITAAKNKVEAERHQVAEDEAVRDQTLIEFKRQKPLHQENLISDSKFQQAEAKLREMEARVAKSKTSRQAAEADLATKQNEGKAKEQRAQGEIDYAKALVAKAESEAAKAESDVLKAQAELTYAQQQLELSRVKRDRIASQLILAPFDGYVTQLTNSQLLKEGDQICLLTPEATIGGILHEDAPVKPTVAPQTASSTHPASSTPSVVNGHPITGTFGPVSDLARRLRESRDKIESLQADLESWEAGDQRAMKKQYEIQTQLAHAQDEAKSDDPEVDRKAKERLNQLSQQLEATESQRVARNRNKVETRRSLDASNEQLVEAEAERDTIIKLLQSQLTAAEKQLEGQRELAKIVKRRFEVADGNIDDVINAEQPLADTKSKIQQLELLLEMYIRLGTGQSLSDPQPPAKSKID